MTGREQAPVKLLLVDDLEENLLALEALLRRPELELLKARSGVEALELLLQHDVALALIDVQMPELDGFELAELMRGSERTCRVPIIFVTAGARESHRVFQGYDAGAVDFLFKPIDPHILRHKVETFVELHRQRQQLAAQVELLRASEELRRRILESSQDLIIVADDDGRVLSLQVKGAERLEGAPEVGELRWPALWEDAADADRCFRSARGGEPARFQSRGAHGELRSCCWDVVVSPIRDARGGIERLLGVARDVSELRRLNEELAATLRLNETFVAAVGHDLRTPLNNVVMSVEILLGQASGKDTRMLERLRSSARRMSKMIDELFDLARARLSGGIPVDPQDGADLLILAEKMVAELSVGETKGRFELTHSGDTRGRWDPDRIAQVLSNLLGNALRHGEPESPVRIDLDGTQPLELVLSVKNRGEIPAELRSCLFEPFRRGGEGHAGRAEGLGLGLFIVQQIVAAHAGQISAESQQGCTTFRVVLPRQVEHIAQRQASA